jgi:hypothetical protein
MKLGAVDYLPKPFTPEQVRGAARRVVAEKVLQRQLSELRERFGEAEGEDVFESHNPAYLAFLQTAQRWLAPWSARTTPSWPWTARRTRRATSCASNGSTSTPTPPACGQS